MRLQPQAAVRFLGQGGQALDSIAIVGADHSVGLDQCWAVDVPAVDSGEKIGRFNAVAVRRGQGQMQIRQEHRAPTGGRGARCHAMVSRACR